MGTRDPVRKLGDAFLGLWIFGGAAYFYIHFSSVFYESNQAGFESLWQRATEFLNPG